MTPAVHNDFIVRTTSLVYFLTRRHVAFPFRYLIILYVHYLVAKWHQAFPADLAWSLSADHLPRDFLLTHSAEF